MLAYKKLTVGDALAKQLLVSRYKRGEAIRIDELFAEKQKKENLHLENCKPKN